MKGAARGTSLPIVLLSVIALGSMAALFVSVSGYLAARRERASASETLVLRRAQADELVLLRRATATLPRSSGDLASRMTAVLASCGLPSSALGSVLPEPPVELPSPSGVHRTRQVARVSLERLTLPALGRILDTWRSAEPAWAITAIDLSAAPLAKALAPGEDRQLRLRATLTLEAVFGDAIANPSSQTNLIGGGT
ncbi:hypothetical protein GPROT1_01104 [Gammaproteobacteria bacterium]|nr:hypothetical protein GPROT1_01104 [Gammaproteobacteria bacterium]